jgi:folate-binding protein YgfZ
MAVSDGNPLTDQRLLLAGTAVVAFPDRGIVTVAGPDRLGWLDSLLSQKLDRFAPGRSTEALLLDPHGHVEQAMRILDDGQSTWLLVDEERAPALATWLDRMRFMKQVEVADVSAEFAAVGFFGDGAHTDVPDALAAVVAAPNDLPLVWNDPWNAVTDGGWQYAPARPHATWNYSEAVVPVTDLAALTASPDVVLARPEAWEALRIAAWRPRLATEGDEHLLPHELDWLRSAVHLSKGCYRGQETVAKVHNLGHPPRRLTFLDLDGVEVQLPDHGALVLADGTEVGHVTAAANHFEDGPIALAVLKRNVATDALLEVVTGEIRIPAHQVVIVPPEAGKEANVPRMPRLGSVKRSS